MYADTRWLTIVHGLRGGLHQHFMRLSLPLPGETDPQFTGMFPAGVRVQAGSY